MSQRPIIGVSSRKIYFTHNDRPYPRFGVAINYVQASEAAGGAPLMLPLSQNADVLHQLLDVCDGLLLTGGLDIDPSLYGEEPHQNIDQINPLRDITEMILAKEALRRDMPIFGICRGMQILNVAAGGSLVQDIGSQIEKETLQHFQKLTEEYPSHSIRIESDSWLHRIVGEEKVRVNSYHHQCVKRMGEGFRVTAWAPDGVPEAMSDDRRFFAHAVQWHPELTYTNLDFNLAMFRAHVEAAGRYRVERRAEAQR
ncbi:MAG: gamma-glutamyl-gamma-aminobutyrate hydrolase family protein [Planctomycetes bacterium]|nr:gamma-glutamyl-gamma-aminobutyrate hydrolase family protein [Planctomycetota bacterium]